MADQPFRRIVLICDAACDIRLAVSEAASLASRWGAALHGVYVDDENMRRFAALPFGRHVSLSAPSIIEEVTAEAMKGLSSALSAHMRRAIAEAAQAHGLQWSYSAVPDMPSVTSMAAQQGDLLVVETARVFSGAWRPRTAWERSPAAFSGTVLFKGDTSSRSGILVLLPKPETAQEKVLSAVAALSRINEDILIAGETRVLRESAASIQRHFPASERKPVRTLALDHNGSAFQQILARRKPTLVVADADDATEWLDQVRSDILLVR